VELVVTDGTFGITIQIRQAPLSSEDTARPRQLVPPAWIDSIDPIDRLNLPNGNVAEFPDRIVCAG
jgi:hypothetical protein